MLNPSLGLQYIVMTLCLQTWLLFGQHLEKLRTWLVILCFQCYLYVTCSYTSWKTKLIPLRDLFTPAKLKGKQFSSVNPCLANYHLSTYKIQLLYHLMLVSLLMVTIWTMNCVYWILTVRKWTILAHWIWSHYDPLVVQEKMKYSQLHLKLARRCTPIRVLYLDPLLALTQYPLYLISHHQNLSLLLTCQ